MLSETKPQSGMLGSMSNLDQLVGQERAKAILAPALANGQLSQALIFVGPDGVGRRTAARLIANGLHDSDNPNHPDTVWFSRVLEEKRAQKSSSPIKSAADEVVQYLQMSPIASKYKVVIIEDADELTTEAQNGLLKTLEEPRPDSILILIVEDEHRLLPTILSRAQVINFGPLTNEEIEQVVPGVTEEILHLAAGSTGEAYELVNNPKRLSELIEMVKFWESLPDLDTETKFAWSEKFKSREEAIKFVKTGMKVLQQNMLRNPSLQSAESLEHMHKAYIFLVENGHIRTVLDNLLLAFK